MYIDRIDIDLLYRPFFNRIVQLIVECRGLGASYIITSGFRTYDDQNQKYAQGRTLPGKIITCAQGGQSAHNFGIAVDFVRDADVIAPGVQPSWVDTDYFALRDTAIKLGLESGLTWTHFKEGPHVQLPFTKYFGVDVLNDTFTKSGIQGVFKLLDQYKW